MLLRSPSAPGRGLIRPGGAIGPKGGMSSSRLDANSCRFVCQGKSPTEAPSRSRPIAQVSADGSSTSRDQQYGIMSGWKLAQGAFDHKSGAWRTSGAGRRIAGDSQGKSTRFFGAQRPRPRFEGPLELMREGGFPSAVLWSSGPPRTQRGKKGGLLDGRRDRVLVVKNGGSSERTPLILIKGGRAKKRLTRNGAFTSAVSCRRGKEKKKGGKM